jgi:uncharacterized membrane protein YraQ (UPF0718 family)
LSDAGKAFIFNFVQIAAGFTVSVFYYKALKGRTGSFYSGIIKEMLLIVGLALAGVFIPLDTYGVLPLVTVMIAAGFKLKHATVFLIANAFFNMTIPFTDITFSWKFGIYRLLFAAAAGILAGIILSIIKVGECKFVKNNIVFADCYDIKGINNMIKGFGRSINRLVPYLLSGVLVNSIFQEYMLNNILKFIYTNNTTSFIPKSFASLNVTNIFFLIALNIAVMLMNFTKLSALFSLFKFRGVLVYYIYYLFLALILSVSVFM